MEKNKVINFQNHPKKELHLTGYLSLPLRVGDRAWIISNSGIHPTSEVEKSGKYPSQVFCLKPKISSIALIILRRTQKLG